MSLAPNLTELLYTPSPGSRLIKGTAADDHPPAVDTATHVRAVAVDFEATALQVLDLILATDRVNPAGDTETCSFLNLPVYFFSFFSLGRV